MTELKNIIDTSNSILPTLSSKAMFWRPRYLEESEWLEHIPFYFWLTEALEPARILETEMSAASSYFALCQAVDKLNLETLCHATVSSNFDNYQKINDYNHEHYQEFSLISKESGKELINEYDNNSIDLFLLKYNNAILFDKGLMDKWQKKLSEKSVVLVHGSQKKELKPICRKLKDTYPTFEFTHGNGLLLVAFGQEQTARVQSLCNRGSNNSGNRVLHDVYRRLGRACYDSWLSQTNKSRVDKLNNDILQQQEKLLLIDKEKAAAITQLKIAEKDRTDIKENLKILADEKAAIEKQLTSFRNESHNSQRKIETLEDDVEQLKRQDSKKSEEKQALEDSISLRFDELAKLTTLLNETETELEAARVEQTKLQQALEQSLTEANKARLAEITKLTEQLKYEQGNNQKAGVELTGATQKLIEQDKLIQRLEQNNQLLEADQKQAALTIEELKQENRRLEQSLQQRFDELAMLTSMLEEKEQQIKRQTVTGAEEKTKAKTAYKKRLAQSFNVLGKRQAANAKLKEKIALIEQSGLFDIQWYTQSYPEAAQYKAGAIAHYLMLGAKKNHNPSADFNSSWYLNTYQDVKEAGVNPLLHYIQFGQSEGRFIEKA
ncbi:hypothetical protein [Endozoicomonas sp. ALC020]|uniref:hypothetical protein n=1 Tax=unclassified Endozoicomonas TaxID=2644528 RepID=UPI003BB0ABEE